MTHLIREISIKDVENFISLLSQIYDESNLHSTIQVNIYQRYLPQVNT